jgi:hypothetical protein
VAVQEGDGFRAAEPVGERRAAFCRLEHVVPWVISGPRWEPGHVVDADDDGASGLGRCAHCAGPLDDTYVLLIRHRGAHRIADAFCDADHLLAWAKAGGRWRAAS